MLIKFIFLLLILALKVTSILGNIPGLKVIGVYSSSISFLLKKNSNFNEISSKSGYVGTQVGRVLISVFLFLHGIIWFFFIIFNIQLILKNGIIVLLANLGLSILFVVLGLFFGKNYMNE